MKAASRAPGKKYGRWTLLKKVDAKRYPSGQKPNIWLCKCDCGIEREVSVWSLENGTSISCGCSMRLKRPFGYTAKHRAFGQCVNSAKRRNLEFHLTEDQYHELAQRDCYYCGRPPSNVLRHLHNNGDYIYNGIDRIDANKGYLIDNVVSCCGVCNRAKLDSSKEEFFSMVKKIYERHLA